MMRLNLAARKNLVEGSRVQSDLRAEPEAVYILVKLFETPEASDGFAAYVTTEDGQSITKTVTAACWFWPEGVLAAVPESPQHVERLKSEIAWWKGEAERLRDRLVKEQNYNANQRKRLDAISAALWA